MIKEGSTVQWTWGNGKTRGKVVKTFTKSITKTFGDTEVTRHGAANNKALLIEQQDGTQVLKLETEVDRIAEM